jgi:FkbM family methyltransferase
VILSDVVGLWRDRVRPWTIPLARNYVRHFPFEIGKRAVWNSFVGPRLSWVKHSFVVSTVHGTVIAGDTTDLIQRYIYYFGLWEPNLTRFIERRLRRGDVFVDVGANIGYYSLLASRLVGKEGSVIAIEASPSIFEALSANLGRNTANNVRALNVAASHAEGKIPVYRACAENIGKTSTIPHTDAAMQYECDVRAAPLTALLSSADVQRTRLVKIDVEGAEWSVVEGMRPLLSNSRSDLELVLEVSPRYLAQQSHSAEQLMRVMSDEGFFGYHLANDYSVTDYLPPRRERRPQRIRKEITEQTDVVFSRIDADQL